MWEERSRVPIKASVKKAVFKRAKGKCESCGISLEPNEGDYHHTRDPTVSPIAKTVQFLCPNCHRRHGHKRTVRTETGFLTTQKVVRVKRLKAPILSVKKRSIKLNKKRLVKKKTVERPRTKTGLFRKKRSDAGKPRRK